MARTKSTGGTAKDRLAEEVARVVGAGRPVAVETVDFNDPNRPKTCLEVDFPILPINQIAAIEGNAGKPIYQMSKWWARRRSSVFRSMLIAAATKAPEDRGSADKAVWDVYYANHQKKGAFKHLKVADIFMGGGTTIIEGSRLGMQMFGVDLNPVAWFVVKNELAQVDVEEVQALLDDIEAEVKPQIMPFYACDCPRGHKGVWRHLPTKKVMDEDFDPLLLTPEQRKEYSYVGPEFIYIFWATHGPCQVTGCGHRTPLLSSPVMAVKTLTVKAWENYQCGSCRKSYDVEEADARMAPAATLILAETEKPFTVLDVTSRVTCPHCGTREQINLSKTKAKNKKVELSLLVHPEWLEGAPEKSQDGIAFGGSVTDDPESTVAWNRVRASKMRFLEVRGVLPSQITCPDTGVSIPTGRRIVTSRGKFVCQAPTCGQEQDVLKAIQATGKTGPIAPYAVQGYCPTCASASKPYGGRFFAPVTSTKAFDAAVREWGARRSTDLAQSWPSQSQVPSGLETSVRTPLYKYNYLKWADFFNCRQLLVHSLLLSAFAKSRSRHREDVILFVLGAFQQYIRNQCMLSFWHLSHDHFAPALSKNNFQPKSTAVEVGVFSPVGYGPWNSVIRGLFDALSWLDEPWEIVAKEYLEVFDKQLAKTIATARSTRVSTGDRVCSDADIRCGSSTNLETYPDGSIDLVVTDPPFGDIMQYGELSGLLYAWLRLALSPYNDYFSQEHVPIALEAVDNQARHGSEEGRFYKKILTACWKEANRILRATGILTFTFHHDKDGPWVDVLESLFDAGFYLEATYPIRSDETKGEGGTPGTFGAQKVEYDIIHVCRKRIEDPKPVSWGRMRREVLADVRQLQSILEHHAKAGLPAADLQVIRRGKALEYFSRHYGKVFVEEGHPISVQEALVGINQLLDEEAGGIKDPPPIMAEPFTRQFLRIFDGCAEQPRDQLQKFLRGTGMGPDEFEERGWCREEKKVSYLVSPLEIAQAWHKRHKAKMTSDYEQAMVLIGACFEGSGINAKDTLTNPNFKPHPALRALLEWHVKRGTSSQIRDAATMAIRIYNDWERSNPDQVKQMELFFA